MANTLVDLESLEGVQIIRTSRRKDDELDELRKEAWETSRRLNASSSASGLVFVGPIGIGFGAEDRDIAHAGTDVTGEFISGPPGRGNLIARLMSHSITVTVVGGLLVAGILGLIALLSG